MTVQHPPPPPSPTDGCRAELERRRRQLNARGDAAFRDELRRVELALSWHEAGLYGACSVCRHPLPMAQLRHDPTDMLCSTCKAAHEKHARVEATREYRIPSLRDSLSSLEKMFEKAQRMFAAAAEPPAHPEGSGAT